ncbi:hypothetical protein M8J75_008129 [Diaphorina citri]|nr:hypothetical protein M8J75_008129 [Diaphorina citri]
MSPKANQILQTAPQPKDKEPIQENPKDNQQPTQPKFNQPQSQHAQAAEYMVYMDENGDAEGNYSLVGRQMGSSGYGLYPVGAFTRHSNMSLPMLSLTQEIDWIGGQPPLAAPPCGFRGEKCFSHMEVIACVCGGVALVVSIVSLVVYRNWRYEQELDSLLWKLDYRDIQLSDSYKLARNVHTSQVSLSSNPDSDFRYSAIFTPIGIYKGRIFAIKRIPKKSVDITRAMKKELKIIRDLRHDNLNGFIGACTEPPNICIVTEYCARGSLKDIMENEDVKLDNMFIASLVADILRGMLYLHDSALRYHGNLKASNCLVDSRWVVKLADFGLTEFKRDAEYTGTDQHSFLQHTYHVNRAGSTESLHCKCDGLLYKAPELLRALVQSPSSALGSPKGDVYSFGIILYELHSRQGPFGDLSMSPATILTRVMYPACNQEPFRPRLDLLENSFDFVRDCVTECWAETPEDRPDFKVIRTRLRPLRKGMKPNIFDNMLAMMEKYANNLEQLVDERTDQLVEEKKKTEALLFEMLPRSVAEQLRRGTSVEAESFDSVTIYFSDIVGFTAMSAESTPLQVVDFLNDLYTCFDSIVGNYDVYKVETIGDAYMVVSGLPIRNGEQHAGEIASMSLDLLEAVKRFTVRHRPHDDLKLRIGIHSGPVCAGVVGLKMPRYCLFGDTVNTASRMESTGEALKIHCSAECKRLLDHLQGYNLKERGAVELKGKGAVVTYWLTGEDPYHRSVRAEQRTHRRNQIKLKHSGSKMKKQGAMPDNSTSPCPSKYIYFTPRSLLKIPRNNSVTLSPLPLPDPATSPLTRCSSLESPKKLRFAPHDNRYPSGGIGIPELSRTSPSELDRRADQDSPSKGENIRLLAYNQNSPHDDENARLLPNQCDGNARSFPENSRSCPTELTVRDPLLSSAIDEDYRHFSTDDSENTRLLPPDGSRNFTNTISDNARFRHEPCPEFCRSEESCDEEDGGLVLKMNRNSSNNPSSCSCNEIRSCNNVTSICNCNEISCNNSCNETNRCCSANSSCNESSLNCNKPNRSIQGSTCDLVSQSPTSPKFSNICCNNSPSPNLVSYQTPYETYSLENPRERNNNAPYSPIKRGDKCEHKFEHNASSMRGKSLSRVEEHFCSSSSCPCVSTNGFMGTAGDMGVSADMSGAVAAKYLNGLVGRGEALSAPNTPLMVAHSESDVTRVPLLSETPM